MTSPAVTTFPLRERAGILGAALMLVGPAQYLLIETIAASAWRSPQYSYFYNFISDLGVTNGPIVYQGRHVESPLGLLMNISFVLLGLFGTTGMLLLSRSLPRGAHRISIGIVAILFGLGGILVGLFPENTVQLMHALGAFLNIGLGNVLLIMVGSRSALYGLPRWLGRFVLILGIIGLAAIISLVVIPAFFNGAVERTAAYPYMFTLIALAIVAMANLGHLRRQAVN